MTFFLLKLYLDIQQQGASETQKNNFVALTVEQSKQKYFQNKIGQRNSNEDILTKNKSLNMKQYLKCNNTFVIFELT
jgi:hypothetical protein